MKLETSRFGLLEIDDQAVITFTGPIIGFQDYRRFVILPGPKDSNLQWLQSTDSGDLAFIIMDPLTVVADYSIKLGAHEMAELAVDDLSQLEIYTLLVVPKDPAQIRTNLKAPVLINPAQRLGKQTILENSSYPVQFLLAQAQQGGQEPQEEAADARSNA